MVNRVCGSRIDLRFVNRGGTVANDRRRASIVSVINPKLNSRDVLFNRDAYIRLNFPIFNKPVAYVTQRYISLYPL